MTNTENRRVLMLCSTFPPESDIGGLRPAMFCKYLPKHGWKPVIFSRVRPRDDPDYKPIMEIDGLPGESERISFVFGKEDETAVLKRRSPLTLIKHFFMPDLSHPPGMVERWIRVANERLVRNDFSVVWGSTPSLGCLTVAVYIAKRFGVPWVADFRDIEEQDRMFSLRQELLRIRTIARRREIVKTASAIVTVSEHHALRLEKIFKRKVHLIHNGYDPEIFKPSYTRSPSDKFSIVYTGRILNEWLRNPRPLFEAIDLLIGDKAIEEKDLDIVFYGTEASLLNSLASSYRCRRFVRFMPTVPYREVPKILQESCVLLVLTNTGRSGILTTKVFEYLAMKRPILCVPGDQDGLDALLRETGSGVSCSRPDAIAKTLKGWYHEWKTTGTIKCRGKEDIIIRYSREKEAEQLAGILEEVCGYR